MSTFFVAVLYVCLEGQCNFITTDKKVYADAATCVKEVTDMGQLIKERFPNIVGKGACMVVRLGEV